MKIIPAGVPIFFGGTSEPIKNKIELGSFVVHVSVSFSGMTQTSKKTFFGKIQIISVFFSYMKINPADFPIFFGGTLDPIKNKIEFRSFVGNHFHWAIFRNFFLRIFASKKISRQKKGVK